MNSQKHSIKDARTCYGHLAGRLGVEVTEAFIANGILEKNEAEFLVTAKGERWFAEFGIDLEELRSKKRNFASACMDWTERRHHLAGALGDAVAIRFFELGMIERVEGTRAVRLTHRGEIF